MTEEIQVFDFQGNDVREITDKDGNPWFVAKDVCDALELTNTTVVIAALDSDERSKFNLGRQGEGTIISESGLYSIIMRSRKPEAKAFKKWITSEVLPSIRKTGQYSTTPKLSDDEMIRNAMMILDGRVKKLEAKIEEDKDKVQFFHDVTGSKTAIEMARVAKIIDCGMGRNQLFEFLRDEKVLMDGNIPYQKYVDNGWFRVVEQKYNKPSGETCINIKTLVYQKGIDGIIKLVRSV